MKKEELNELKEEVASLKAKLAGLTDDELAQITGGSLDDVSKRLEGIINVGITIASDETHGPISR